MTSAFKGVCVDLWLVLLLSDGLPSGVVAGAVVVVVVVAAAAAANALSLASRCLARLAAVGMLPAGQPKRVNLLLWIRFIWEQLLTHQPLQPRLLTENVQALKGTLGMSTPQNMLPSRSEVVLCTTLTGS